MLFVVFDHDVDTMSYNMLTNWCKVRFMFLSKNMTDTFSSASLLRMFMQDLYNSEKHITPLN